MLALAKIYREHRRLMPSDDAQSFSFHRRSPASILKEQNAAIKRAMAVDSRHFQEADEGVMFIAAPRRGAYQKPLLWRHASWLQPFDSRI